MTAILDTHVWLWMQAAPSRLGSAARALIEDSHSTLLLSAASSWEIAIKYALGRLPIPEAPELYVPERMRTSGVLALPIEHAHALRVATLAPHHRDPFDRLLVAQAQLEGVPLLTADPIFDRYDIEVIRAV
ncbi:MAG: type II toxin-antitoxin system VapC family toxin [Acidimicrobiia bacterium]|nr:type II toxin-antitoxin system VapC family toxin [Acidimicrobiia bacterium]